MADPIDQVITLRADTSKLDADLAAAKAKAEAGTAGADAASKATTATNAQTAATSRLGDELRKVKKTYGEQIEVVQGLIGKIMAVGAVTATFYKIGEVIGTQIVDKLQSAADKANDFLMTVNRADPKAAIKQIADQVQVLNAEIASTDEIQQQAFRAMAAAGSPIGTLFAKDREKLVEERKRLVDQLKALGGRVARDAAKDEADIAAKAAEKEASDRKRQLDTLNALNQRAILDAATDEERLVAESQARIVEIQTAFNALSIEDQKTQLNAARKAIGAIEEKAIADIAERRKKAADDAKREREDAERKAEEERESLRRWYDEQEQAASRVRQAWVNSFRAIRDENNKAFATDQAASMVQFAQQLRIEGMVAQAGMNRIVVEGIQ